MTILIDAAIYKQTLIRGVNVAREVRLPEPKENGLTSIEEILNKRRSIRDYKKGPLSLEQISQLFWAALGRNLYRRTAPWVGDTFF